MLDVASSGLQAPYGDCTVVSGLDVDQIRRRLGLDAIVAMKRTVGLILQSPPTSLLRVLLWDRGCFKQPFNQKSCCGDRLCLYDKIGDVRIPVLVIHGEDDRTVPIVHGKCSGNVGFNEA
ncbi:unnamed protein product [Nippostrongylus brasiliensis]|uniref:Peptidase_S9 domain-containing protein n=1 Tax=Nippostrongylus brasiliensis TaxID=27835 RepID=A0A0N4YJP3_NIPBR|nr:unnamed protein product [Nippostrongylus brasiliensis]